MSISGFFDNISSFNSKKTLFKFDKSTHIEVVGDSAREHKRNASDISTEDLLLITSESNERKKCDKVLICQPDPSLIRKIYLPLLSYMHEIEELMKSKSGQPNTFEEFLSTQVKDVFLAKGHNRNLQITIETLSKNHDAWRAIISPEEMKQYGLNRPLLQSTVLVENSKHSQFILNHFIFIRPTPITSWYIISFFFFFLFVL